MTNIELGLEPKNFEQLTFKINGRAYRLVPVDEGQSFSAVDSGDPMLVPYVGQLIEELKRLKRQRTAETYKAALNSFLRFREGEDIPLAQITSTLLIKYEQYLRGKGISSNSSSYYMRVLRTIYNRAVNEGYVSDQRPFTRVYTGIGKTDKRALPLDIIRKLSKMEHLTKDEAFARDIFLFSFFTRGMAFVDISYLTPSNVHNGMLTYRRQKTGQQITMRWEPQMEAIVRRNPSENPDFLLPIIRHSNGRERNQYRYMQELINEQLHLLGERLHLQTNLTFYVARHSWASAARSMDIPVSIISAGMGHHSERTTQIYLRSLDINRVDNMNAEIIQAVVK